MWRLNNKLLVTEEIKEKIKKFLESNKNENIIYQSLWDTENAVLRGKFIAISAYIKKKKEREDSQINNRMMYLKHLEKQEQIKPQTSRQREIIKIRAEINEIKTKKTIKNINETKVGSLKRLTRLKNP
jgi:hypothetical protein